jgi:anti-sigma B factor antagonist
MKIEVMNEGPVLVARVLERRLDAGTSPDFRAHLGQHVAAGQRLILLNLAEVEIVDSAGIGSVLSLLKSLPADSSLGLCGVRPAIREVLRLTRLDRVLHIWPSESAARRALAA